MTSHTVQPSAEQYAIERRLPPPDPDDGWSMSSASLIAGVALLLMSVLAGVGNFVAVQGLVTQGDAARTAQDVMGSEGLFRLGIVSLFLVVALDVVVAWALYRVFSPVSRGVSLLAALFRLVYAGVFLVAISQLVSAVHLLGTDPSLSAFTPAQLQAQALSDINAYTDIWTAGLVLFGIHLLLVGYLAYRSAYVPRFLGVLLVVAGLGYGLDSVATVLSDGAWTNVSAVTFVGEFLLALWLVVKGRRLGTPEPLPLGPPA
jgi:Domain of unknown function (DUF4386)